MVEYFPKPHHCTFLCLFSLISGMKRGKGFTLVVDSNETRCDFALFIHPAPLLHISLNPLNLIRIIDLRGVCLFWSGCTRLSSPLRADQAPTQTAMCKDSLVTDQRLN